MAVAADTGTTEIPLTREKVLVFGGNGFIGSEFVRLLLHRQTFEIIIVSRGNWYFDSEIRIKPFVTHIVCDRENSDLEACTELFNLITSNRFKYVFDFSAYKPESLQESVEALNGRTDLYVYISTDSVYEVCEKFANGGRSREVDSVRPDSEDEQERLNDLDDYGNQKLQAEEVLIENRAAGGAHYLILRLADVLGPRDTTDRIWIYIMWIAFYDVIKVPISIPKATQELKTSYVYVKDVARAILHLIEHGQPNQIYNVAFEQLLTLHDLLQILAKKIGKQPKYNFQTDETSEDANHFNFFPSVTRGGVDITKLKDTGFIATDFSQAIQETVAYYKEAFYIHESERDDAVHELIKYAIGSHRKGQFMKFIDDVANTGKKKRQMESMTETNVDLELKSEL